MAKKRYTVARGSFFDGKTRITVGEIITLEEKAADAHVKTGDLAPVESKTKGQAETKPKGETATGGSGSGDLLQGGDTQSDTAA